MRVKVPFRVEVHKPEYAIRAKVPALKIACFCILMGRTYYHEEILFTVKRGTAFTKDRT